MLRGLPPLAQGWFPRIRQRNASPPSSQGKLRDRAPPQSLRAPLPSTAKVRPAHRPFRESQVGANPDPIVPSRPLHSDRALTGDTLFASGPKTKHSRVHLLPSSEPRLVCYPAPAAPESLERYDSRSRECQSHRYTL